MAALKAQEKNPNSIYICLAGGNNNIPAIVQDLKNNITDKTPNVKINNIIIFNHGGFDAQGKFVIAGDLTSQNIDDSKDALQVLGSLMSKNGLIVLASCGSGGLYLNDNGQLDNELVGKIAKYTGTASLASQSWAWLGFSFNEHSTLSDGNVDVNDDSDFDEYHYAYIKNLGLWTLAVPTPATQAGYSLAIIPTISISSNGSIAVDATWKARNSKKIQTYFGKYDKIHR